MSSRQESWDPLVSESQVDTAPARPAEVLLRIAIQANLRGLTSREREVLKMVIEEKATKTIAFRLGISPRTVEVHRIAILRKTLRANFLELSNALHELSHSEQSD